MGASRNCGTFTQRLPVDGLDHGSLGGDPFAVKETSSSQRAVAEAERIGVGRCGRNGRPLMTSAVLLLNARVWFTKARVGKPVSDRRETRYVHVVWMREAGRLDG